MVTRVAAAGKSAKVSRPPKLRLSCDECAARKVKCSREQPSCERCVTNGISCIYGPSKRRGKPPCSQELKLPQNDEALTKHTLVSDTDSPAANHEASSSYDTKDSGQAHTQFKAPFNFFDTWNASNDASSQISSFDLRNLTASIDAHLWASRFPPLDSNDFKPPLSVISDQFSMAASSVGSADGVNPFYSHWGTHRGQHGGCRRNCYELTYLVMDQLRFNDPISTSASVQQNPMTSDSSNGEEQSSGLTLDNILQGNKDAIHHILLHLDCPCAADTYMTLLYASVASKILIRYREAVGFSLTTQSQSHAVADEASKDSNLYEMKNEKPANITNIIKPILLSSTIQLGTSPPDEELQGRMIKVLLLGELMRLNVLIDVLSRILANNNANADSYKDVELQDPAKHLYATFVSWLKRELEHTKNEVKNANISPPDTRIDNAAAGSSAASLCSGRILDDLTRVSKCSGVTTDQKPIFQPHFSPQTEEQGGQDDSSETIKRKAAITDLVTPSGVAYSAPADLSVSNLIRHAHETAKADVRKPELVKGEYSVEARSEPIKNDRMNEYSSNEGDKRDDGISTSCSVQSSSDWYISFGSTSNYEEEDNQSNDIILEDSGAIVPMELPYVQLWVVSFIDQYVSYTSEWLDSHETGYMQRGENNDGPKHCRNAQIEQQDRTRTAGSGAGRARKHRRNTDGASSDDEDNQSKRPRRREDKESGLSETVSRRLFACFFHKREPLKFRKTASKACYKSCPGGYPTVHRLWSDHCRRLHKAPIHCPRCKNLFETQEIVEHHLHKTEPACAVNNEKVIDGVNENHRRAYAKKLKHCKTEKKRWESIYAILFPGEEVPDPYIGPFQASSPLGQEMTRFAENFKLTDLPRLLEPLPSSETLLPCSELYPKIKSVVEEFMEEYNAKLLKHLGESKSPLSLANPGCDRDENQNQGLSTMAENHLNIDSKVSTPGLALSSGSTQESQESEAEHRITSSIAEPSRVMTQGREKSTQSTCGTVWSGDYTRTQNIATLTDEIPRKQNCAPESLDPQNLLPNAERFQGSQSNYQFQDPLQSLFLPDFRLRDGDLYSAWMQGTQITFSGMYESHEQGQFSDVLMDDQSFHGRSSLRYGFP